MSYTYPVTTQNKGVTNATYYVAIRNNTICTVIITEKGTVIKNKQTKKRFNYTVYLP